MADMLSTGVSGLLAFQQALNTTSNNITNVNTPGYSRQTTNLATRLADPYSTGWIGNGVDSASVTRSYDQFIAAQVRTTSSNLNQSNTFSALATNLNNVLGDSATGLSATLQNFTNAVQTITSSPSSIPTRQALLSQAQSLVQSLQSFNSNFQTTNAQINNQLQSEATTVNSLAQNIAQLNQQISIGYAQTGQPPNDLLDQRDSLIDQLATHLNLSTVQQSDGSVNVFVGSGQQLVLGSSATQVVTNTNGFDPSQEGLAIKGVGASVDITKNITGGTISGLLNFRSQILNPAINTLGQLTVALTNTVNTQNQAGMDLNGALGQPVFAVGGVQSLPNVNNTTATSLAVSRTSTSALTPYNYIMTSTAGGWQLTRADTGAAVPMAGAGTVASPFTAVGLSIVVTGAPAAGDQFMIQPTAGAVNGLSLLTTDPAQIAAAAPILGAQNPANTGSAAISQGQVLDAANAQLLTTSTIQFQDATHYTIDGGASQVYTSGGNIAANGWQVQITGTPAAGDQFTVSANTNGTGDNRNAQLLAAALNSQPILNGGTTSLSSATGQLLTNIGVQTNQATTNSAAQQVIYNDAINNQQSVSGVNLDEEAANMLRYQQAYQAAAQIIKTGETLFQSILTAVQTG